MAYCALIVILITFIETTKSNLLHCAISLICNPNLFPKTGFRSATNLKMGIFMKTANGYKRCPVSDIYVTDLCSFQKSYSSYKLLS